MLLCKRSLIRFRNFNKVSFLKVVKEIIRVLAERFFFHFDDEEVKEMVVVLNLSKKILFWLKMNLRSLLILMMKKSRAWRYF